jgi:predicted DNA-binding transcriptional regulator AlpA
MRLRETPLNGEVFVRARRLAEILSVNRATVWRWSRAGRLPKPHRIGPGTVVWRLADVYKALDRLDRRVA